MNEQLSRRSIVASCCAATITLAFFTAAPALCLTRIAAELGMDTVQKGFFLSAAFWGVVGAVFAAGPLADRLGFRAVLIASAALQSLGLLLVSLAHQQWTALSGSVVLGAGVGAADALVTSVVCAVYPERRTRVSNLLHSFYPMGLILTIVLILVLLRWGWDWRPIYRLLAVIALPYGVAVLILPFPRQTHGGERRLTARRLVTRAAFMMLFVSLFLAGVTELGPALWLPSFVEETFHLTETQGGLGLLLFAITMSVGRLAGTGFIHRIRPRTFFVATGIVCSVSLLLAALPIGPLFSIVWLAVLGFGVAGLWPTILATAGDRFPAAGASMFSLLSAAGNLGGIVGPVTIGAVADRFGLHWGMALLAVAPFLMLVLMSAVLRSREEAP